MNLQEFGNAVKHNLKDNSPVILTGAAAIGVLSTAYLTAKATFQAAELIRESDGELGPPPFTSRRDRFKQRTKLVWRLYIPAAASAVTTVACVVGANRVEVKRTLAAQAAFAVTERAYSEYRDQVVDEFGEHKDRSIRDKVAKERVLANPPSSLLVSGPGNVLCCELYTGRYFTSDIETIRKAVNKLNEKLLKHDWATLDDWYHLIGLRQTSYSGETGWQSSKLLELSFTTILTDDERPCLAFEYNYVKPI